MLKILLAFCVAASAALCAEPESLLIGPGDLVRITVVDTPDMDQVVRVTDQGTVSLVYAGELKVAGDTPRAAAKKMEEALIDRKIMLHPQVLVNIDQYATQNVAVMGQVQNPGSFGLVTPQPILKVLSLAGGMTDMADRHIGVEHRVDGKIVQNTYFLSNESREAIDSQVLIYPGDTVVVPKAGLVYVLGDVSRPGGYPITTNDTKMTALQALAFAGSANHTSLANRATLIRKTSAGTQQTPLKLADMQHGKIPDLQLQADDIIYIPFSWIKNIGVNASAIAASTSGAAIYTSR